MRAESEYQAHVLAGFAGWIVKGAGVDGEDFCLILENPRSNQEACLWVMCDEEGNGPGAITVDRQ